MNGKTMTFSAGALLLLFCLVPTVAAASEAETAMDGDCNSFANICYGGSGNCSSPVVNVCINKGGSCTGIVNICIGGSQCLGIVNICT